MPDDYITGTLGPDVVIEVPTDDYTLEPGEPLTFEGFKMHNGSLVAVLRVQPTMGYVFCSSCDRVTPLLRDILPEGGRNTHAAEDLVCAVCHAVLATLHESDSPLAPEAADATGDGVSGD